MSGGLKITLRAGERMFINGAVIKVDRKVGIELMNDVTFLLEQHFMQPDETTTPLRQLYFMIQTMLVDPSLYMRASALANESLEALIATFQDSEMIAGLTEVSVILRSERPLEALKKVRILLPREQLIFEKSQVVAEPVKEVA